MRNVEGAVNDEGDRIQGEKTAIAVGWEKPGFCNLQLSLFGDECDAVLSSAHVSLDDMARWYHQGWISYDAASVDELDEAQRAEMLFVRDIACSGLPDVVVSRILSELPRPYAYSLERVAYSFHFGWVQLPYPLSMDKMMATHLREWLDEQIEEGNMERLIDTLEQLTGAFEGCHRAFRMRMEADDS